MKMVKEPAVRRRRGRRSRIRRGSKRAGVRLIVMGKEKFRDSGMQVPGQVAAPFPGAHLAVNCLGLFTLA
jgi:hypothetical protein